MTGGEGKNVFEDAWLALMLAWIAGNVDAIGYLTLGRLFTAHMSGNTAAMGAESGAGQWAQVWQRVLPIPLFVVGVGVGYTLAEIAKRRQARSPFAPVFGLEALLLLAFLLWGGLRLHGGVIKPTAGWEYGALVALPAVAMGVQNSTLHRVGNQNVRTTYISGMLTNFAEQSVELLLWLKDQLHGDTDHRSRVWGMLVQQKELHLASLFIGIWCSFVIGAVMGATALQSWAMKALLLPLIGTLTVIGVDRVHPIAQQQMDAKKP